MFTKLKFNFGLVLVAITIVSFTILAPTTSMFGRSFKNTKDFTCCKGDQLYYHHYYVKRFFWVEIGSGYTVEPVGKPTPGGCNIQCTD